MRKGQKEEKETKKGNDEREGESEIRYYTEIELSRSLFRDSETGLLFISSLYATRYLRYTPIVLARN